MKTKCQHDFCFSFEIDRINGDSVTNRLNPWICIKCNEPDPNKRVIINDNGIIGFKTEKREDVRYE